MKNDGLSSETEPIDRLKIRVIDLLRGVIVVVVAALILSLAVRAFWPTLPDDSIASTITGIVVWIVSVIIAVIDHKQRKRIALRRRR